MFQNLFTLVEARVTIGTRLVHGNLPHGNLPHGNLPHGNLPHGNLPHCHSGKIESQVLSPTSLKPTIRFQGPADAIWILGLVAQMVRQ